MATKKKLLQAAAGSAGGAGLDVDEVFSTYLYEGNGSTQTITNGIDLDGEGGAILTKRRDSSSGGGPWFNDTERGITKYISTSDTGTGGDSSSSISAVTSSGYTLGGAFSGWNNSSGEYASWTFRKAPKFFDVVKYVGDRTQNPQNTLTLNHNLGSTPGMIIVKCLDDAQSWAVYHRTLTTGNNVFLNLTTASGNYNDFPSDPTSTTFTVGSDSRVNFTGRNYVAYLFAHNDGDGEFGPDADQDIIKCGVYSGNDASQEIDVGFEPQWLMIKRITDTSDWIIYDSMRNWKTSKNGSGDSSSLEPNTSDAEQAYTRIHPSANGFGFDSEAGSWANQSAHNYIYIAIRRGPMAVPTDATDVFQPHIYTGNGSKLIYDLSITPDMVINMSRTVSGDANAINDRLRGSGFEMYTDQTGAEYNATTAGMEFDYTNQIEVQEYRRTNSQNYLNLCWKRAPNYFDMVCYTGNGTAGRTVSHNLGVAPEMMWIKCRSNTAIWPVYHKDLGGTKILRLNETNAEQAITAIFNNTNPTSEVFTVGNGGSVNNSGDTYIAYLFASLDGVSKVGSYSGTGSDQTIDCGFSSGARFVIVKNVTLATPWYVFDTERGIVAGNDPFLKLNDTTAETTVVDFIDPHSSGFTIIGSDSSRNAIGSTYIFYAIA